MILEKFRASVLKGRERLKIEGCFWIHCYTLSQLWALALKLDRSVFKVPVLLISNYVSLSLIFFQLQNGATNHTCLAARIVWDNLYKALNPLFGTLLELKKLDLWQLLIDVSFLCLSTLGSFFLKGPMQFRSLCFSGQNEESLPWYGVFSLWRAGPKPVTEKGGLFSFYG